MRINGGFYCMSIQDKMFDRNIYGLVSSLNIYHDRFRGFTVNTDLIPVRLPGGMKVRITDPEKIEVRFSLGHSLYLILPNHRPYHYTISANRELVSLLLYLNFD